MVMRSSAFAFLNPYKNDVEYIVSAKLHFSGVDTREQPAKSISYQSVLDHRRDSNLYTHMISLHNMQNST